MKKLILLLAIIGIGLTSCNGKYTIAKRKYTKGFYVNRSGVVSSKGTDLASTKNVKAGAFESKAVEIIPIPKNESLKASNTPEEAIFISAISTTKKTSGNPKAINHNFETASSDSRHMVTNQSVKSLDMTKKNVESHKKSGNTNEVLLIVLCIFIPFLAVYLFQDKIGIDFWIDLLLCLVFWLPGIIFAFLVCFGGVSLE